MTSQSEQDIVTTWNGAASFASMQNPLVQLFFKAVRNITDYDFRAIEAQGRRKYIKNISTDENDASSFYRLLSDAWEYDSIMTRKCIFHIRDCRQGRGEKKLFRVACKWMLDNHPGELSHDLEHIPEYGSWKDLLIFLGTELEDKVISLFAKQLTQDLSNRRLNLKISLCAKYAPSEGHALDNKHNIVKKLCRALNISPKQYRKEYLVPLRQHLNIVERQLSAKRWSDIEYSYVPSIANKMYQTTFKKHDGPRYSQHCRDTLAGKSKINTGTLMSCDIVKQYVSGHIFTIGSFDEAVEAQWKCFMDRIRESWSGVNMLPIVDLSGSMFSASVAHIALSLGLVAANMNTCNFAKKWITFAKTPVWETIKGDTLHEQLCSMASSHIGLSTNLQATFDLLLTSAITFGASQEQLPNVILILSDMQFDQIQGGNTQTNWQYINDSFEKNGYKRPIIVFWNLSGRTVDYPIPSADIKDCILISGFNDSLFKAISVGTPPNPFQIVKNVLSSLRYEHIV